MLHRTEKTNAVVPKGGNGIRFCYVLDARWINEAAPPAKKPFIGGADAIQPSALGKSGSPEQAF